MKKICVILLLLATILSSFTSASAMTFDEEVLLIQEQSINGTMALLNPERELNWTYIADGDYGQFYALEMSEGTISHDIIVLFANENDDVIYNEFFFYLEDNTDQSFFHNFFDLALSYIVMMESGSDKTSDDFYDILNHFAECIYEYEENHNYEKVYRRLGSNGGSLAVRFDEEHMAVILTAEYF